jgi:hypothetical protein
MRRPRSSGNWRCAGRNERLGLDEDMQEVRSDQKAIRDLLTDIRIELAKNPTQVPFGV